MVRKWEEQAERHRDWGQDGMMAVAVRHLGWRMAEVVRQMPGVNYAAAAQEIRRFWRRAQTDPARPQSARRLPDRMSKVNV